MKRYCFSRVFCLALMFLFFAMIFIACGTIEFKVDFVVDDVVYASINTNGKETIKMPNDPEKEGYIFDGWYWDKDSWQKSFTANSLLDAPLSDNMSVYAKWSTAESLSGTQADFSTFEKTGDYEYLLKVSNSTEEISLVPFVSVNSNSSWSLATDVYGNQTITSKSVSLVTGDNMYYVLVVSKEGSTQLYTLNIRRKPMYTVTFNTMGGTSVKSQEIEEDAFATAPKTTRIGYDFAEWNFDFTTPITEDIDVVASWTAKKYIVTFDANNGIVSESSKVVTYNASYTLPTTSRTGYVFVGWYDGDTKYSGGTWRTTSDITLTAKWILNEFTIALNANGGTCQTESLTVYVDASYTLPTPSRTGYTFAGWYCGDTQYSGGTWETADNVTLTAKWIANTNTAYTVNHYQQNIDDDDYTLESTQNLTGTSDASVTPSVNTYTGFTSPSAQTVIINPDGSCVVNYYYTRNYYTVTVIGNGGTNNSITQKYQSAINTTGWTTRDEYTLGGLYTDAELSTAYTDTIMLAQDKIIYAYWIGDTMPTDFTYTTTTSGITIKRYTGSSTIVRIPTQIGGIPVTSIGSYAFQECTSLTSITIPDGVTSIGSYAFYGCSSLNAVHVSSIEAWCNISFGNIYSNPIYYAHNLYLNGTLVTELVIPDSVTSIGNCAFSGCTSLRSITIPDSVTSIGNGAFYNCSKLTSITIPNGVTSIGDDTFCKCSKLTSVTIPDSVTSIGSYAFSGCSKLTSITIGNGVTSIGKCAFNCCSSLTSITIPDSVTSIGDEAFYKCSKLTSITLPNGVTSIGGYMFYECSKLTSITIPDSVTRIYSYAFYFCLSLTSVTIPDSVTSIGRAAFSGCSNLNAVHISSIEAWCGISFTGYYSNPLYYAHNLYLNGTLVTELVIPDSVTSIGNYAFSGCTSLVSITIPDSVTSIDDAFGYCYKLVEVINKSSSLNITVGSEDYGYIGYYAKEVHNGESKIVNKDGYLFYTDSNNVNYLLGYAGSDTSLTLPADYNGKNYEIYKYAFYNCTSLTSVTIGNSVTSIGSNAFYNCYKLVEVINRSSLNIEVGSENYGYIGYYAIEVHNGTSKIDNKDGYLFYTYNDVYYLVRYVGNDTSLTLPADYNGKNYEIYKYAFRKCRSLTSVTIPDSVTSIGVRAFYDCISLTSVTFENTSGWYVSYSSTATSGTAVDVTNVSQNAIYLNSTYYDHYWKRK